MKWFVLALCALGTESATVDEPIPFSGGSGQIFASSDDLIKSFRRQKPVSPESPAVIPNDNQLPDRLPTTGLEPPLEPSILSHLHPRSTQHLEQITEQNSTQMSVGAESSSQPNGESIDQSHHVTSGDSQLKPDCAPPGMPGQFAILQVQVREIFPEQNSHVTSVPELPRPNFGQSVQLPNHVHEVPEEDSREPMKSESEQPQHGQSVQLPKHVHEVTEEEAPQPENPELAQSQHGPSDQLPRHVHEVPEKGLLEPTKTGSDRPQHSQSDQLPKHVHEVPEKGLPEPIKTESDQPQHGQSDQLSKHVHEVSEKVSPEPIKTGSDQPQHGQSDQLPKHVHEVPEKDSPEPVKTGSDQPQHGQPDQLPKHVHEVPEKYSPEPVKTGSDRPQHGQSDQLSKHVQEVSEKDPQQPIFKPSQLVQQLEDHVLPLIPETKLSDFAQSLQQFPNLPPPEHDTPLKSVSEPVRQNSGPSKHLSAQVSIGQQDTPSSIVSEAPPRPNFDRSLHLLDDLSVPHSSYTEAYDIEWHKESNTARTVIENSTTIYRKLLPDGRIQYLEIKSDRTSGSQIRRCTMSPPLVPTSSVDTAFPGLPEMGPFQFRGYTTEESRSRLSQLEHWQYIVFGRPGQGGAAREESVNVTHDFFAFRDESDAVPLRYTVTKDSSVLGSGSDTYTHRYTLLPAPTAAILPDTTRECDVLDELKEDKNRRRRTAGTVVG